LQAVNAAPSSEHLKLELGAEEMKLKLASLAVVVAAGPAVMVVSGGGSAGAAIVQV
jgi:hypothetical protein